jgi:hypothetical protein
LRGLSITGPVIIDDMILTVEEFNLWAKGLRELRTRPSEPNWLTVHNPASKQARKQRKDFENVAYDRHQAKASLVEDIQRGKKERELSRARRRYGDEALF